MVFAPDGATLALCGQDRTARIWNVAENATDITNDLADPDAALAYRAMATLVNGVRRQSAPPEASQCPS